jgi:hypothetical protein
MLSGAVRHHVQRIRPWLLAAGLLGVAVSCAVLIGLLMVEWYPSAAGLSVVARRLTRVLMTSAVLTACCFAGWGLAQLAPRCRMRTLPIFGAGAVLTMAGAWLLAVWLDPRWGWLWLWPLVSASLAVPVALVLAWPAEVLAARTDRRRWPRAVLIMIALAWAGWVGTLALAPDRAVALGLLTSSAALAFSASYSALIALQPARTSAHWARVACAALMALAVPTGMATLISPARMELIEPVAALALLVTGLAGSSLMLAVFTRWDATIITDGPVQRVRVVVTCPRCERSQPMLLGRHRCTGCGLGLRVELDGGECPRCGYCLTDLVSGQCPECGLVLAGPPAEVRASASGGERPAAG